MECAATNAEFVERLLEASDDCIKIVDLDARLIFINPNGQRAFGIDDFGALAGTDWRSFWSGVDRVAADAAIDAARTGERGRFTGSFPIAGRERSWEVTVTPIRDSAGRPERILIVSRDVTEALVARRSIAQSEERLRVLSQAHRGEMWTALPHGALEDAATDWLATLHPDDRERVLGLWRASLASGETFEAECRAHVGDGASYRWLDLRALPQRESDGSIVRWVGVTIDIDERRRADEAREQFVRLIENSDEFVAICDLDENVVYVNAAGCRLIDLSVEKIGSTKLRDFFKAEDWAFVESIILPTVLHEGRWTGDFRLRNFTTGQAIPILFNVFPLLDDAGETVNYATVSRDIRARTRLETGLRMLAETGAAANRSLDFDAALRNVADAIAGSFASICTIDIVDDRGGFRRTAASQQDPGAVELFERAAVGRVFPQDHPIVRALSHDEATLIAALPADWVDSVGLRAAVGIAIDTLHLRSLIVVPIHLESDRRIVGALACLLDRADPRGSYTVDDLSFAREVASRLGVTLRNARAYEREHRIAVTLQEASLPKSLPAVDHVFLSAEYRPGKSEATIGGDWYDAIGLDDGRVAFTIGDVLGKGLDAAVTMGRLRQAMQAVALVRPEPNAMLDVAERIVRSVSSETYATALAAIYDPATRDFTFASAGHAGPVLRYADGRIEEFTLPGLLLGLRERGPGTTMSFSVPPGSAIVLFTDGLTELTRDIDEGHRVLHAALAEEAVIDSENPARALVESVLRGRAPTDDIAVLVAEVGPSPRFDAKQRAAVLRNGTGS